MLLLKTPSSPQKNSIKQHMVVLSDVWIINLNLLLTIFDCQIHGDIIVPNMIADETCVKTFVFFSDIS